MPSSISWNLERFGLTPAQLARSLVHSSSLPPPFMLNSIPKSGTHLLERVFSLHPDARRKFVRKLFLPNLHRYGGFEKVVRSTGRGQYLLCHLPYDPEIVRVVQEYELRSILIVRDPRAILVSEAHYLLNNTKHERHPMVAGKSFEESLDYCISYRLNDKDATFADTATRFLGWLDDPHTCVTRYEDLVSGSREAREAELARLFRHVGLDDSPGVVGQILDQSVFSKSLTFRKGDPFGWRDEISPEMAARISALMPNFRHFGYDV